MINTCRGRLMTGLRVSCSLPGAVLLPLGHAERTRRAGVLPGVRLAAQDWTESTAVAFDPGGNLLVTATSQSSPICRWP